MIGSLSSFNPLYQQWWMRGLEQRRKTAEAEAICLALACICLGTGLRTKFRWSIGEAYIAAFLISPLAAVAIPLGLIALRNLFRV